MIAIDEYLICSLFFHVFMSPKYALKRVTRKSSILKKSNELVISMANQATYLYALSWPTIEKAIFYAFSAVTFYTVNFLSHHICLIFPSKYVN